MKAYFFKIEGDEISALNRAEKTCFSNLNIMILQSIRWMNLKIGEHLDMQISYKILRLELS